MAFLRGAMAIGGAMAIVREAVNSTVSSSPPYPDNNEPSGVGEWVAVAAASATVVGMIFCLLKCYCEQRRQAAVGGRQAEMAGVHNVASLVGVARRSAGADGEYMPLGA